MTEKLSPDQYELMEKVILSEQMSAAQIQGLMRDNPDFAKWIRERAEKRQGGRS